MKISIIIPFKDSANWLSRCASSVRQKGDFEIIFINDHSTDGCEQIIEKIKDERVYLFDNEHKAGVSGARNTGIDHATGEWITFLDADDEMLPNAYEIFCDAIEEDARANIHQFNHMRYYPTIKKLAFKYANAGGLYSSARLPIMWFGVWNKIYKAELIKDVRFSERLQYGEDGLFVLECLAKDDYIHHAPKNITTVKHRFDNPKSLSRIKKEKDIFKYVRELESFIRRQDDPIIRQAVCQILSDDWKSDTYMKTIGLRDD